jgi:hypothetical protein
LKILLTRNSANPDSTDGDKASSSRPDKKDGSSKQETPTLITPSVARLAPPFERPKRFPAAAFTVGCNDKQNDFAPTVKAATLVGLKIKKSGSEVAVLWETDKSPEPGRSGGPLLDEKGQVIGICLAYDTGSNHGFFTHLDEIQAWMKKNGYAWVFENK